MKTLYVCWTVYEETGFRIQYYVINTDTHQVQSVWKNRIEAKFVCDKLNRKVA